MEKIEPKLVCERCEKEMPINKEKSNENLTVYETMCECGGKSKIVFPKNYGV